MKLIVTLVLVIALLAGGVAFYLHATIPTEAVSIGFPLSETHQQLLSRIPASADSFALIPSAASLQRKLGSNPATRDAIREFLADQPLPGPWLLGGAEALVWREEKTTSYAIRFDPVRAVIARAWTMSHAAARWEGPLLVIENETSSGAPLSAAILQLTAALPAGDLLVVQRKGSGYPPIERPAVTSATISAKEIVLTSRSPSGHAPTGVSMQPELPQDAMVAAAFIEPPRLLGDLSRLVGADVGGLVANGGSVVLYEVDSGTLLPRPRGVIVVPDAVSKRTALERVSRVAEAVGEMKEHGTSMLVAFDRTSVPRYLDEEMVRAPWQANRWVLRIDPVRLVPVLRKLSDSRGLRYLAPRVHRSVRDLNRWSAVLEGAAAIEAADSVTGGTEELRVRVLSK